MKRILIFIVIISLLVSSNVGLVSAMNQPITSLEREKDRTEIVLENLVDRVDGTLEKADNRISDTDQSEKIQEKQEEIKELLEEIRISLEEAKNKTEVKEILEETKDIITLKTSAALTPTVDVTESLESQKLTISQKTQAKDTLLASLDSGERNTLMIRSRTSESFIREKLGKFDDTLFIDFQFEEDGYKVYELSVSKESLLSEELLENLDSGEVPGSVLGIEIIRPELFQIGALDLNGEDRVKLWGVENYGTPNYLDKLTTSSSGLTRKIRVGIIDTGIESSHKDLVGQVNTSLGYDFVNEDIDPTDDQGHGTHIAGTIAGKVNGAGVFGINPSVELVALKICDSRGFCPSYSVLKALSYAKENHFDILNMSLGARGNPETSPICSALKDITANGTIVVAAAGNSNVDTSTFVPGGCASVITVAAIDDQFRRAPFSNYGAKVDVAAPGVGIYSTYIGGGYKSLNGTSMATPHIVGLVSIIQTYKKGIRTDEVKTLLKSYSSVVNSDATKPISTGVNVLQLVNYVSGSLESPQSVQKTESPQKIELPLPIKVEQKEDKVEKTNTGIVQAPSPGVLEENIARIDESIGLIIQNTEEKVVINSLSEGTTMNEENTVRINSSEGEETELTEGVSEEIASNGTEEYSSESVEINSAESDDIDFENLNLSGAIVSTGTVEKSERTVIEIDPAYIPESESVEINSSEGEEFPVSITEGNEETVEDDSNDTMIQNTFYCTIFVGGNCGYNLPAASTRQYQSTNSSILSLSVGGSSFTLYGRQVGNSTLFVKQGSRTLATVYVSVTQPILPLRAYYGTNSLMVGGSTYLSISSGNGGYSVTSSNSSIVSVSGSNVNWTLSARGAGMATISYRDSRGQQGSFVISVTAPPRDIRANIGTTALEVGGSTNLSITDGNGGYSVTSSNVNIASISGSNTSWTISARASGMTTISVRDSRGKTLTISLNIVVPSRTLRYSYGATSLSIGGISALSITDGNGGYSVSSSNSAVLSVTGSNTTWTVKGISAGMAQVTIRDSRGKTAAISYTILAPLKQVKGTISSVSPRVGDSVTFTITDGNGGYSVVSSNTSVISVASGTDKNWNLKAQSAGQAIITVSDNRGSRGSLVVNVQSTAKQLTLDKTDISVEVGSDVYFRVTSGNGGYSHTMNNSNVGWYYDNSSIPSYRVRGLTPGTTILQIKDSAGKMGQVVVTVKSPGVKLNILRNKQDITSGKIGGVHFTLKGERLKEVSLVGIKFTDAQGKEGQEFLDIQSDGEYIVGFSETLCKSCKNFQPFYILGGTTRISSVDELGQEDKENVEINGDMGAAASWNIFLTLWYTKGYDNAANQAKKKVRDFKKEYGNTASTVISLIPAVGEGYDIITLIGQKDPITGEQLSKSSTIFTFIGLASGVGSGKAARDLVSEGLERLAKELGVTLDEVKKIAESVAVEYTINSIYDIPTYAEKLKIDNFLKVVRGKVRMQFVGKLQNTKGFPRLENHFNSHGIDFGVKNKEEYLVLAEQFAKNDNPRYLIKINIYRDSILKYDPDKNIFISVSKDTNEIRTFYKPDGISRGYKSNLDYFNAQ